MILYKTIKNKIDDYYFSTRRCMWGYLTNKTVGFRLKIKLKNDNIV